MKKLNKVLDKCTTVLCVIGAVGLSIVILIVLYNVIARGFFNRPYARSYEVVQYGALACILLGLTRTTFNNGHIQVTLLIDVFPKFLTKFFDGLGRLLNGAVYLFASWLFLKDMPVKVSQHKLTDLFHIPMQYIDLLFVIFLAIAAIIFIIQAIECFIQMGSKNEPLMPPEPPVEAADSVTEV